jgi:hypothetical protein
MTMLHDDLRRWADESAGVARMLGGMADAVGAGIAGWSSRVETWTGSAAVALEMLEDRLVGDVSAIGEAIRAAATAHHVLSVALDQAVEIAARSAAIGRRADDATRAWRRRWASWEDVDADAAPDPPPVTDPGDTERRRAEQLADEARRAAAGAAAAFAADLDVATAAIPTGERRSLTEVMSEFGSGVVDSVRDTLETAWGFSTIRMVLDGDGWRRDVEEAAQGIAEAVHHPGEAFRQMLDVDTWRDNPARAAGRLAPDLVVGVLTGGAGAGAARARSGVRGVRRATGDLADAARPARREYAPPRPDDPSSPVINLTAVGDRMGDNANRIAPLDGHVDVAIHGSPTAFGTTPNGPPVPPSTVADMIAGNPKFDGRSIRLVSCRSGASTCGAADTLADELGVDVLAPDTTVWVYPDGRLVVGEGRFSGRALEITEPGEWIRFAPGER